MLLQTDARWAVWMGLRMADSFPPSTLRSPGEAEQQTHHHSGSIFDKGSKFPETAEQLAITEAICRVGELSSVQRQANDC
jgi:hypothetical protein